MLNRYTPSWVDRLTGWVRQLPGPDWVYYLGIGIFLLCIQTAILWIEGAAPTGTTFPVHIFLAGAIPLLLAWIPYLDDRASAALGAMRPALTVNEEEYPKLRYQLTTLPALPTILANLIALAVVFLAEAIGGGAYRLETPDSFPLSANLFRILYLSCWWFFGAFVYHTIHQLRLINRIYTRHSQINLFRMEPLYALSNLAALTAGSLIVLPYSFLLINPSIHLNDPVVLGIYLVISLIAVITFLWPQLGIHRLQNAERDRLLDEANRRYEATIAELHKQIDENKLEEISNISVVLGCLETEINRIKSIPTWPWQPETVRWLFTALVLPLIIWIAQYFLQRMLGP